MRFQETQTATPGNMALEKAETVTWIKGVSFYIQDERNLYKERSRIARSAGTEMT
jgi:hypothetical protein